MVVTKRTQQSEGRERESVFEDNIKQPDRIETFTIEQKNRDIQRISIQITQLQERKVIVEKQKTDALAL